jgi:hypothetical protein
VGFIKRDHCVRAAAVPLAGSAAQQVLLVAARGVRVGATPLAVLTASDAGYRAHHRNHASLFSGRSKTDSMLESYVDSAKPNPRDTKQEDATRASQSSQCNCIAITDHRSTGSETQPTSVSCSSSAASARAELSRIDTSVGGQLLQAAELASHAHETRVVLTLALVRCADRTLATQTDRQRQWIAIRIVSYLAVATALTRGRHRRATERADSGQSYPSLRSHQRCLCRPATPQPQLSHSLHHRRRRRRHRWPPQRS